MQWQVIVALVIAVPIILVPVVFVWYLNVGGIYRAFREARQRRKAALKGMAGMAAEVDSK